MTSRLPSSFSPPRNRMEWKETPTNSERRSGEKILFNFHFERGGIFTGHFAFPSSHSSAFRAPSVRCRDFDLLTSLAAKGPNEWANKRRGEGKKEARKGACAVRPAKLDLAGHGREGGGGGSAAPCWAKKLSKHAPHHPSRSANGLRGSVPPNRGFPSIRQNNPGSWTD